MSLNDRQQRFVSEYCVDWNATQAAIRAGYSEKSAKVIGSENLTKPDIRAAILARKAEIEAECALRIMGKHEVLQRLSDIAAGDIGDFDFTSLEGVREAKSGGKSKLIKKAKITTIFDNKEDKQTDIIEFELYSAHDALRDLGKHHALFTDKSEISINPDDLAKMTEDQLRKLAEGKPL